MDFSDRRYIPGERLTPSEATQVVDELYRSIDRYYQEQILNGSFMRQLRDGKLALGNIRRFWVNWYGFVSEINNFNGIAYQRFNGFFKRHPDLMAAYADKIADELIHPTAPGHIQIVMAQGRALGLSDEEMVDGEMEASCRAWSEWFRGLAYEANLAEFWSGHQVEQCIGDWAGVFRRALLAHYDFSPDQLEYFQVHEEADLTVHEAGIIPHAEFNRLILMRILTGGIADMRPGFSMGYAARMTMEYFRLFLEPFAQSV